MNLQNVLDNFQTFNDFARNEKNGGINRIAFTHPERLAALKFSMLCQKAGLDVYFDFFGNVIARREGKNSSLKPVVLGSHIDTVRDGGQYDGLLGVLGALEVIEHLNKHNIETDHPIIVIAFACEESTRFNEATLGSKYLTGKMTKSDMQYIKDNEGNVLYDVVEPLSQDMHGKAALFERNEIKAFLELHIEQGPILEKNSKDIGIVTDVAAPHRFKLKIQGVTSHSGSTPMPMRVDALTTASEIILSVESIGQTYHDQGIVTTVGYANVYPNTMNAIPGGVTLLIDIRGKNLEVREQVVSEIQQHIQTIVNKRKANYHLDDLGQDQPRSLNKKMAQITEQSCLQSDFSFRYMYSGAGHDAMNFAPICPTSMIFIPCKKGISHSPEESVTEQQIAKGIQVYIDTTIELANLDVILDN
ncbi:M20 family metallo-hydrolase [Staphylococcus equorum]|uniref:M20 family metallo-hydrolase n=1 Tax=Staphylococcus equorum TaxID=246432 RepID=A0A9X4R0D1_9STAP|nr:M20 family metallo-hydrolase [Staphylococcus equorum]MDG0842220.1 M20 family metallo-hydrolase [Staphylococcus equorum]MDG0857729.1 M20 family metallo-hydrolase [Staphylococcus equorum]